MPTQNLIRIIKDWDWPDLLRQTPGGSGIWGEYRFTLEPVERCDYAIVLNNRTPCASEVVCPAGRIWSVMQEPYIQGLHDWMIEGLQPYGKIFSHHILSDDPRWSAAHPMLPWHINRDYDQLIDLPPPQKSKNISWIFSRLSFLPLHRRRLAFKQFIESRTLDIDIYGRGFHPLPDKWEGLAPYYYSLAIENARGPDYWSEKIVDALLSWTIPVYYGCTNLREYFPQDAFIEIDLNDFTGSLDQIRRLCTVAEWQRRRPALQQARELILNNYQFFPYITSLLQKMPITDSQAVLQSLPAYGLRRWRHRCRFILQRLRRHDLQTLFGWVQNIFLHHKWKQSGT